MSLFFIFFSGLNDRGQLGIGSTTTMNLPTAVDTAVALNTKKISFISAGQNHVAAVDINGVTYVWGDNAQGELGQNSGAGYESSPGLAYVGDVLKDQKIVMVSSGMQFTLALNEKGRVFGWGANSNGNCFSFFFSLREKN